MVRARDGVLPALPGLPGRPGSAALYSPRAADSARPLLETRRPAPPERPPPPPRALGPAPPARLSTRARRPARPSPPLPTRPLAPPGRPSPPLPTRRSAPPRRLPRPLGRGVSASRPPAPLEPRRPPRPAAEPPERLSGRSPRLAAVSALEGRRAPGAPAPLRLARPAGETLRFTWPAVPALPRFARPAVPALPRFAWPAVPALPRFARPGCPGRAAPEPDARRLPPAWAAGSPSRRPRPFPTTAHSQDLPASAANRRPNRNRSEHTVDVLRAATSTAAALSTKYVRRRPTLPRGPPRSTIGAEGLNFRVRNGTGCFPFAMAAETLWRCHVVPDRTSGTAQWTHAKSISRSQATRPISTGQLHTLPCFHLRPINPVV